MNERSMKPSNSGSRLMIFAAVGVVAAAAGARSAEAAQSPCMDTAWAEYNECLVESRWESLKKLCDLAFYYDAYACTREAIAE